MLQGHGDDGYRFDCQIVADFSTNVWYGGTPPGLKEHLFERWESVSRYPEPKAESLCRKIADHHELHPENILVNNGSTESIYLIAQAFSGAKTTILIPTFSEYEDACNQFKHEISFVNWDDLSAELTIDSDLFFICNPNNPSGAVFLQLGKLIEQNPGVTFIVDEAFIDFTQSITSCISLIERFNNLILLRSLTKCYAIAGLRLGYIAAHAQVIKKLTSLKFPWSVNTMACHAGHFYFENFSSLQLPVEEILTEKKRFSEAIEEAGIKTYSSHTHFLLAELETGTARTLKHFLLKEYGFLIRDASNFRGLTQKHFRLATLSPSINQTMIEALKSWQNR